MRRSYWSFVLKRAAADRLVVATSFLSVLLAVTLVSAIPIYAKAVAESSLRARLERAPVTGTNLQATVHLLNGGSDRALDLRVGRIARDVFGSTRVSIFRSRESEPFSAVGRTVVFGSFDRVAEHARLVAGRWPGRGGGPVEVAVPDAVSRELHLRTGERVRARNRLNGHLLAVRVVGIYRAERPGSAYWWAHPLALGAQGPLVATKRAFFSLGFQDVELRWRLQPDLVHLTIGRAGELRRKLTLLPGRLNAGRLSGQEFTLDTGLPGILAGAERSLHLARAGVLVPSIQLLLLAVYGLILTAALLTERRALTTEGLRLRGAATSQLVIIALGEASLIALPAVAAAPWLAAASLHGLNHVGPLAAIGLRLEPRATLTSYAFATVTGLVCVLALALPAWRAGRVAIAGQRRRLPLAGLLQRARLDLVLALLALLGYWQLRRYHGVLVSHRGSLDIDPFLVVAPALLLLAGALLLLRLVPLGAALVERFLGSTRGAVAALGFWQLARRPRVYARSILLLVLAVAIGVFAASYSHTWHRSQIDQAQFAAGADLVVEPSYVAGSPPAIDLASSYRALGARIPLPAVTDSFDLSGLAENGNLLALDARRAAGVIHVRSDFASRSLDELLQPLGAGRGSLAEIPLPAGTTRLALSLSLSLSRRRSLPSILEAAHRAQPSVFLYLRDGDGVVYLYRLRGLTGHARRFVLDLAHRLPDGRLARPRPPLAVVGLEFDLDVPYLVARRATLTVRELEVASRSGEEWQRISLVRDHGWRASALSFKYAYEASGVEGASTRDDLIRAVVTTGSSLDQTGGRTTAAFFLRPGRDSLPPVLPVLASDSFLSASDARVGQIVRLALSGGTHAARIVGAFHRFPTLAPGTPAVVADLPSYMTLTFSADHDVVQPSTWWLSAGNNERIADMLRAPPFSSVGVVSGREREHALLNDPVPLGVIGALALGFVVAAAFAVVGFAAGAAAAARTRMLEFAVLRALGLRTRQLSGWVSLESALVVVLSLLGGTALGLLVSWLVLPYVALGTSGAAPVPPVRLAVPWATVVSLDLALLGTLIVLAAVQVGLVRRLGLASTLRSAEGALAP